MISRKALSRIFLTRITYGFTSVLAMLDAEADFAGITAAIDEELAAREPTSSTGDPA